MQRHRGIERIGPGRYRVRVRYRDPRTGKDREVDRRVDAGSLPAAAAKREELRSELLDGGTPGLPRTTLRDYGERWLEVRAARLRPSTADHYAWLLAKKVNPALGDFWVDAIRPGDVEAWQAEGARKHAPETVNGWLRLLKTVMRDVARDYGIPDPTAGVRPLPRRKPRRKPLTVDELRALLAYVERCRPRHYAWLLAFACTGMRWGELMALRWEDIDEEAGCIRVERSHVGGELTAPKSGEPRTYPLPAELAAALRAHRRRLLEKQHPGLAAGWCFATRGRDGLAALRYPSSATKALRAWCKAVGITRPVSPHTFRRTYVDMLRQARVDAVVARALVGHASEEMRELYSTVVDDEKRHATDQVVRLVVGGDR